MNITDADAGKFPIRHEDDAPVTIGEPRSEGAWRIRINAARDGNPGSYIHTAAMAAEDEARGHVLHDAC